MCEALGLNFSEVWKTIAIFVSEVLVIWLDVYCLKPVVRMFSYVYVLKHLQLVVITL